MPPPEPKGSRRRPDPNKGSIRAQGRSIRAQGRSIRAQGRSIRAQGSNTPAKGCDVPPPEPKGSRRRPSPTNSATSETPFFQRSVRRAPDLAFCTITGTASTRRIQRTTVEVVNRPARPPKLEKTLHVPQHVITGHTDFGDAFFSEICQDGQKEQALLSLGAMSQIARRASLRHVSTGTSS